MSVDDVENLRPLSRLRRGIVENALEVESLLKLERSILSEYDGSRRMVFQIRRREKTSVKIEAVAIPRRDDVTLCLSSQSGCALACSFCATGLLGFQENLTTAEILEQHAWAERQMGKRVTDIVFMGMGEPLANYRNLIPSLQLLLSDYAYGLSRRRITVSTSGIVPHIDRLSDDCNVSLAVSLHAASDTLRNELVPINKIHPIAELLAACWRYAEKRANRFITFEYVMLRDINDTARDADDLIKLLQDLPAKVNLLSLIHI